MISLILAESALELVPTELLNHPSITSHAKRMQKNPSEMLLDNSWHYAAMKGIKNEIKRGRPDLVHISVLAATDTPLYKQNQIKIYIHTINDYVISLGNNVNIPRSYHRFAGLIENLFIKKTILVDKQMLLKINTESFPELINRIKPSKIVGLSTKGRPSSFEKVGRLDDVCFVVGGFQKGHFSESIQSKLDQTYSVGEISYDAHVIIARLAYEYEKTIFM